MAATEEIRPYRIDVADDVLADLKDRLARTRWPDQIPGTEWEYGANLATVQDLCRYWQDEFDWRAAEAQLNEWPQFETEIDGVHLHFIHARSPHPDAFPLIITHGWPGSVAEFLKILGPLTDPPAHGGDASDAFHVVAPSMPGYGFSGPTTRRAVDIRTVAELNAALMARLGYSTYGAQGGDWGAAAATQLGFLDAEHVAAIHLNMVTARPPDRENPTAGVQPDEMDGITDLEKFRKDETGYQAIQGTKPQTLAYGLTDSPAGLAAWILEKFRTWSDCGGDVFSRFTRDELLTNITIYWVTGTINASTRMYYESMNSGRFIVARDRVEVPTGAAIFPKELFRPPRAWADASYNIVQWTRMPSGGHFAAMEEPDRLVDDVRSLFRRVR
jgi:pimeloyl-ACP methyl ester carboxylesterase